MQITVSNEGAVTVVKPVGPITAGELEELDKKLDSLNRNWTKRVVINMSEVAFIDSAGLELFIRYQKQLDERGLKLKLCGMNEITQKIFDITQLSRFFEIFADTTGAVRSFL
ncbi:MAG: hypothetical protein AMJ79_00065 [Phycisphaerae bacterium SM23_30]|nr:MAG: hypothetical protein AMJ79_00065 [Phycisphaerae bacterium SM23_30]